MIVKPSHRRLATAAALWLSAAAGCQLPNVSSWNVSSWKLPEPQVPDVHPMRRERNDDAIRDFDERRNAAQYLAAQTSWRQGDYDRCRESLEKVLDRDPNHRGSLLLSADVALETERPQEAVDVLRRVLALDPHDAETAYRLGLALETVGEVAEAVPYLRQAAAADPQNPQYTDALNEAEAQFTAGDGKAGAKAKIAAAPPVPEVPQEPASEGVAPQEIAFVGDAQPLNSESTEIPTASDAPSPIAAAPMNEAPHDPEFAAAMADWEANRVVPCAAKLAKILEREPDHIEANILQAEIDLNGGQPAAAMRRMDRLVVRHPRNFQVRQACGLVNEAAGNVEKANLFFHEAESLAEADMLVAVSYQEPLDGDAAETTASLTPVETDVLSLPEVPQLEGALQEEASQDAKTLLANGQTALTTGKISDARRLFKAAVARGQDDPHTAVTASIAALKLEQPELALELASAGATAFPKSAALHRIRGMAAYRLGQYVDAEAYLRQSLNLDNSQALSYFLLGSAQNRLGKTDSAQRNLREAARLDARYAQRR